MSLKENLQIQTSGAVVGAQEGAFKLKSWYLSLQAWQRVLLVMLFVLMIPGYFAVRYGLEVVMLRQYGQNALVAQPAYTDPEPVGKSKVNIINNSIGTSTAYALIKNPNLDLAAPELRYTFKFYNNSDLQIQSSSGVVYLLPDQQRWLVVPRIETLDPIARAELAIEDPEWQKRLSLPEVQLRMTEPFTYEQENPLATVTEGSVINNSPYSLKQVSLVLVLYGQNNQVLAVTSREEFTLQPYERRAYIIQWPGIARNQVTRIGLESYTNVLDETNLTVSNP